MQLPAGTVLDGRYEVVRSLGQGGMATVYEVRHLGLGSTHALKVLASELSSNEEALKRFLAEGRIQARLRHPNVVAVTEIVTSPVPGLVMEYAEGGTLSDWLTESGRIQAKQQLLELFLPVLDAVGEAHRQGVVHRDLKPDNIIVSRGVDGKPWPRVTDFGIARVAAEGARMTRTGARMGTLNYMSPEQVQGADGADARSDIFSLGAILYELATGQQAFSGKSDFQVMGAIVAGQFPPVREVSPDVDAGVVECIERALRAAPGERFQSCAEFARALSVTGAEPHSTQAVVVSDAPSEVVPADPVPATPAPSRTTSPGGGVWNNILRLGSGGILVLFASIVLGGAIRIAEVVYKSGSSADAGTESTAAVDVARRRYKLDATEVTVAAYAECVNAGFCTTPPSYEGVAVQFGPPICNWKVPGREQHPMNCVSWYQADAYCKAQGKRLPKGEEWEVEASNGGRTQFPWGDSSPDATKAHWKSSDGTVPVGTHPAGANRDGIQDLAGNVDEWMADDYLGGKQVRGGSWSDKYEDILRVRYYKQGKPGYPNSDTGFRCVQ